MVDAHGEFKASDEGELRFVFLANGGGNSHGILCGTFQRLFLAGIDDKESVGRETVDETFILFGDGSQHLLEHGVGLSRLASAVFSEEMGDVFDFKVDGGGFYVDACAAKVYLRRIADVVGLDVIKLRIGIGAQLIGKCLFPAHFIVFVRCYKKETAPKCCFLVYSILV